MPPGEKHRGVDSWTHSVHVESRYSIPAFASKLGAPLHQRDKTQNRKPIRTCRFEARYKTIGSFSRITHPWVQLLRKSGSMVPLLLVDLLAVVHGDHGNPQMLLRSPPHPLRSHHHSLQL